ncbi:MAG: bifunctional deaminase-reductase domain protein [Bacteroidetes bacterium]|nr:bifunctional deaminase-reductase domain protein [Bacteroidota bacterium]
MRKLKLQVQISVDGFICGPAGEMDWLTWSWDDQLKAHVTEMTATTDTIILGRKLAEGFIPYWTDATKNPNHPEHPFAHYMHDYQKFVFSKTVTKNPGWENTEIMNGDMVEEVKKLKAKTGKDIIVYGGAGFVSSLIGAGLIDEFNLFINPTAIGKGMPIFSGKTNFKPVTVKAFDCGITLLCYQPAAENNTSYEERSTV